MRKNVQLAASHSIALVARHIIYFHPKRGGMMVGSEVNYFSEKLLKKRRKLMTFTN